MTHLPVDGICVGSHPFISMLMKGIFNLCPPCPRYVQTWDVSVVLHYLITSSSFIYEKLDFKVGYVDGIGISV